MQSDAEAAREQTEACLSEADRAARRQHADLDSRAARLEAQLHQQGLDMDSYRRRSEAEASMLQKRLDMTERAQRYPVSFCRVLTWSKAGACILHCLHRSLEILTAGEMSWQGGSSHL